MAEQWGTLGLCFSWITGADGIDSVQKGLKRVAWQDCNRSPRVPPVRGY